MNCKEFEMGIYIYPELSEKERNQIDIHLQNCQNCSALFQEAKQAQQWVNMIAEKKPSLSHAAQFTGRIMSKIMKPSRSTPFQRIYDLLLSNKSKFVLSATSSLLLVVFFIQSYEDSPQMRIDKNEFVFNSVILNAKLFRDNFSQNKAKHALFADCRSPFQSNQNYLNCVKSKLK